MTAENASPIVMPTEALLEAVQKLTDLYLCYILTCAR